jgi:hypothetical protein
VWKSAIHAGSSQRCENGDLSGEFASLIKGRSWQELNLASRAGAEAITCNGWQETNKECSVTVRCRRGESYSSHATDPVAITKCSP